MHNVSIQIPHSFWNIEDAREDLDALYDWLSNSPSGTDDDLFGLDVAIDILSRISFQMRQPKEG